MKKKTLKKLSQFANARTSCILQSWDAAGGDPCGNLTLLALSNKVTASSGETVPYVAFADRGAGYEFEGIDCRYQDWMPDTIPRRVTNFHLPKYSLGGRILKSFALLEFLVELDFDTNGMSGPIPPEISCLSLLREFDFANNDLSGPIPPELSHILHLEQFKITNNTGLTGCLPPGLPPFADHLCTDDHSCSHYNIEHNDVLDGTRNYGTAIDTYCTPDRFPPCINDGKTIALGYNVVCPLNAAAMETAPIGLVAPVPPQTSALTNVAPLRSPSPVPASLSPPPPVAVRTVSPPPPSPPPRAPLGGFFGGLFGGFGFRGAGGGRSLKQIQTSEAVDVSTLDSRTAVLQSGAAADGPVESPTETPTVEPPTSTEAVLCRRAPADVVAAAKAQYKVSDPALDYGADVWEATLRTSILSLLDGTKSPTKRRRT